MSTAKWVIDPSHSEILFKVKHMMITNVKGEFRTFSGDIDGEDFRTSPINIQIEAGSIFTNDDNRDGHLKSPEFFDVENHSHITFVGTNMKKVSESEYELTGDLSLKGITKSVTLQVEFGGINKDPWGNEKVGFSVTGAINRKDWGLTWNAALETGGVLVSEEVKIQAEIQFAKQA